MIKHSESIQSNKFVKSLQCLKKEVMNGVHLLEADKHQNFYKLSLLFLLKVTRHVKNTRNRKLLIFLLHTVMFVDTCSSTKRPSSIGKDNYLLCLALPRLEMGYVHQKLAPDPFLILLNNPKQPC